MSRRFIAGAKCPACGGLDSLAQEAAVDGQADWQPEVWCVACGHRMANNSAKGDAQIVKLAPGFTSPKGQLPDI